jgi:hypothetical protein
MSSQNVSGNQKEHSVLTPLASLEFSLRSFDNPALQRSQERLSQNFKARLLEQVDSRNG